MKAGQLILAYHGCDITIRDDLVSGRMHELELSNNRYDWLGPGVYFFEHDAQRAFMFANTAAKHPERLFTKQPIATPSAVGAILQLQSILDMNTQEGIEEYALAYVRMAEFLRHKGEPLPQNSQAYDDDKDIIYRALDRAVFGYIHSIRALANPVQVAFQAVRSAFPQGDALAPSSAFKNNSHIQIALLDSSCVRGWFLPAGANLLSEQQYAEAQARLAAAKKAYAAYKPRKRIINKAGNN